MSGLFKLRYRFLIDSLFSGNGYYYIRKNSECHMNLNDYISYCFRHVSESLSYLQTKNGTIVFLEHHFFFFLCKLILLFYSLYRNSSAQAEFVPIVQRSYLCLQRVPALCSKFKFIVVTSDQLGAEFLTGYVSDEFYTFYSLNFLVISDWYSE